MSRRTPPPEPALVGCYPRDDVPRQPGWRGAVHVHAPGNGDGPGPVAVTVEWGTGGATPLDLARFPVGAVFAVRVEAFDGSATHHGEFSFRVTGDEADVSHHCVGPGLTVTKGRWGRRTVDGFEFGVLVMGAVPHTGN